MENRRFIYPNVTPFNEFYLGSCYTEAYVPAIAAFGISPDVFLANNYSYFQINESRLIIRTAYIDDQTVFNSHYGLVEENLYQKIENLPSFLLEQLSVGKLCLCRTDDPHAIDSESGQETAGSGEGVIHWLLVYGYDLDMQLFFILEHRTNFSALYRPMEISFEELSRAYNDSFKSNILPEKNLTILWKEKNVEKVPPLSELLIQREKSRRKIAPDSTEVLSNFYNHLAERNMKTDCGELLIQLNMIIEVFRKENFILSSYGQEELFQNFEKNNNLLRSFAIKTMMGKTPKPDNYVKYCESIRCLLTDYKELCDEILSC